MNMEDSKIPGRLLGFSNERPIWDNAGASFFIKDLAKLVHFYNSSIRRIGGLEWSASGGFTCSSAYRMMNDRDIISPMGTKLWKIKIPMKVKVFMWLLFDNKILSQEIFVTRGCIIMPGCHMDCGSY